MIKRSALGLTTILGGILATMIFMTTSHSDAADFAEYQKDTLTGAEGQLPYRFFAPDIPKDQKVPLILFLHGAGERGDNNVAQLRHGGKDFVGEMVQGKQPCFVVAPQCPSGEKWVDVPWSEPTHDQPAKPSDSMALTLKLLDKLIAEYPIDTSRIYVTGLSMGGFGTWDLIARQPNRFAAAIPICGGADTKTADTIKHIPIWVFHGDADGAVKVSRSRDMVAALKKAGGEPKYTEYPGVGHDSWTRTYKNPEVYDWLFSQKLVK